MIKKKRFTAIMLASVMLLSLAGCTGRDDTSDIQSTEEAPEVTDADAQSSGGSGADAGDVLDKLTGPGLAGSGGSEQAAVTGDDQYILSRSENAQRFYTVDSAGNMTGSYDRDEIKAMVGGRGSDYVRLYDEENCWYADELIAFDGRFLYFTAYERYGSETGSSYVAYAIDTTDYEPYLLWRSKADDGSYIDSAEYYDGALHVSVNFGRNTEGHLTKRFENCYSFDENANAFTETSAGLEALFDAAVASDYNVLDCKGYYADGSKCFAHILDDTGWILAMKDEEYIRVTADGEIIPIKPLLDEGYPTVATYDEDYIYFTCWDSDTYNNVLYSYDVGRQKARSLTLPEEAVTVLGYLDGALYYSVQTVETYGYPCNTVYAYRGTENRSEEVYDATSEPGVHISPGTEGFRIIGDRIYYVAFESDRLEWVSTEAHASDEAYKPTGCAEEDINAFRYGRVEGSSAEWKCPYCGTTLFKYYVENFVPDDECSPNADKIADFFMKKRDEFLGSMEESDYAPTDESDCEYHLEYPVQNCITDDLNVGNVEMLASGKYMTVSMYGYWYGGGAHGYPSREQYLFDVQSGEQITIGDLYKGTEEEYKRIVAEATQEDFLTYTYENSPYFSSDSNEVYNQAYEEASFDNPNIEFDEEGVTIFYPPYDMGAYASGYIDVKIPYERLNINL